MRRILSFLLAFTMLLVATGCQDSKKVSEPVKQSSLSAAKTVLGYDLLSFSEETMEQTSTEYRSVATLDDTIGIVTYSKGKSTVTLRMTVEEKAAKGLAGFENAAQAGGIDSPAEVFSSLSIYVLNENTYYCEFSYTYDGYPCYLSLAQTQTNFNLYSALLIAYVNQLYAINETPSFVLKLNPDYGKPEESSEYPSIITYDPNENRLTDIEDASTSAEAEPTEQTTTEQPTQTEPTEQTTTEQPTQTEPTEQTTTEQPTQAEPTEQTTQTDPTEPATTQEGNAQPVTLNFYDMTLVRVGDAYTLQASGGTGSYKWTSDIPSVATVSEGGTVTAVAAGTARVTCTSGDGLTATCIVRVKGN